MKIFAKKGFTLIEHEHSKSAKKINLLLPPSLRLGSVRRNEGFTLIELLVVIAIIGILVSIVLVSLGRTRNKSKDARVIAEMIQIRAAAEMIYSPNGNYNNVVCTQADMKPLCDDIAVQTGGTAPTIRKPTSPATEYCAYVKLIVKKDGVDNYYCIDSRGVAEETANPSSTCGISGGTYKCP